MTTALETLKTSSREVHNLAMAAQLLGWDQETYMPDGGAHARAEQIATLAKIAHEKSTDPSLDAVLKAAALEAPDVSTDDGALVRVSRRAYDRAVKVPAELTAEMQKAASLGQHAWIKARANDDYESFKPFLARNVELRRQLAETLGYEDSIYDPLLDEFETGMKAADVNAMFNSIKGDLIDLVAAISEKSDAISDEVLRRDYDKAGQQKFSQWASAAIGYDYNRGRIDEVAHPFCTNFSINDVRITTRYMKNWLSSSLFGTMHEAGHAMYEQGSSQALEGLPTAGGTSLGVHESQSRLWENLVGRNRAFWDFAYGELQSTFPTALGDVSVDEYYRAINKVTPSLIRVEADEVTYNLHILIRFEMEQLLLNGDITVDEAPKVWNDKYEKYLGVTPPNDADGIMQDVHWSAGYLGYFPTYSIGNLLSVQILEKAVADIGDVDPMFAAGNFEPLLSWLQSKIYVHGSKFMPKDLMTQVLGGPMDARPYMNYLTKKFGALYGL